MLPYLLLSGASSSSLFSWWNWSKERLWVDFHIGQPMWSRRDCHYAVQWSSNISSCLGTLGAWALPACPPVCLSTCPPLPACLPVSLYGCTCVSLIICLSASEFSPGVCTCVSKGRHKLYPRDWTLGSETAWQIIEASMENYWALFCPHQAFSFSSCSSSCFKPDW